MCAKSAITVFKFPAHAQALLIDTFKNAQFADFRTFLCLHITIILDYDNKTFAKQYVFVQSNTKSKLSPFFHSIQVAKLRFYILFFKHWNRCEHFCEH